MKKLLALVLTVMMLLAIPAIAEEAPLILSRPADAVEALEWAKEQTWDKTYTIGFANIAEDNTTANRLGDYIEECAAAYGMNVIRVDNNYDGMQAVTNCQSMLQRGIEALIEFNVDESVGGVIMEMCDEAGIPVMAIDIPHPGATFFGADNAKAGTLAGEAVAKAAQGKWGQCFDCLLLVDQMASGDLPRLRVLKAEDGLRTVYPDFDASKVFIVEGGQTVDEAQIAVSSFLNAHPNEKISIVVLQGTAGVGTLAAVRTADREADVVMIVNNEDYFFTDVANYDENSCFAGAVTFQLMDYGQWIMPAMREILDTGVQPENVYVEHKIVTRENIDELFPGWRDKLAAGIYSN